MYSAGLGYRVSNYYVDLAYQNLQANNTTTPYSLNNFSEPVANIKTEKHNFFLTFGLRF